MARENPTTRRPVIVEPAHSESLKDTVESIVVAFILAFVFRTFVVEAFVIPTGSMATSLYGKHGALVCEDCGWENSYGLTDTTSRKPQFFKDARVQCQNCNHANTNLAISDGGRSRAARPTRGNAESGDRILVFKWPLDFGISALAPERWDVTVFKNTAQADENFIKRLAGKPNEVLEIIDGDVYVAPIEDLTEETLTALEKWRKIKFKLRSGIAVGSAERAQFNRPFAKSVLDELADKLRICKKTPAAQQSLWHVVYDHDYPPRTRDTNQPYWEPQPPEAGDGWVVDRRRLHFSGGSGDIRFAGKQIVDYYAYNINMAAGRPDYRPGGQSPKWHAVADQRLETVLHPLGGDGYLELTLTKNGDRFSARVWSDGRVHLLRAATAAGVPEVLAETLIDPLKPGVPIELAFENLDYRVALTINQREILATTEKQYAPDIPKLRTSGRVRKNVVDGRYVFTTSENADVPIIRAVDIEAELLHVVLSRDAYYTSPAFARTRSGIPSWAPAEWGTTGYPILLREGEYFMLGDNSPASKDSRLWDLPGSHLVGRGEAYQLGTVPADQIVGRAFFVYWPSGLRPGWMPVLSDYGVIPNVGRMRWIR